MNERDIVDNTYDKIRRPTLVALIENGMANFNDNGKKPADPNGRASNANTHYSDFVGNTFQPSNRIDEPSIQYDDARLPELPAMNYFRPNNSYTSNPFQRVPDIH